MENNFKISLWSLAGLHKVVEVNARTRVADLCKFVNKATLEFCDIKFLAGSQVLQQDAAEELWLYHGAVVQVAASLNLAKATSAVEKYFEVVRILARTETETARYNDPANVLFNTRQWRKKFKRAVKVLSKVEDMPSDICDELLSIIGNLLFERSSNCPDSGQFSSMMNGASWDHGITFFQDFGVSAGVLKKGQFAEDIVTLCELFGRTCNNPAASTAQLLQAWNRGAAIVTHNDGVGDTGSHCSYYYVSLFMLIVFTEIDMRDADALPMGSMKRLVQVLVGLQDYYITGWIRQLGSPARTRRKRVLRISASVAWKPEICNLICKFGDVEAWHAKVVAARRLLEPCSCSAEVRACELLMHLEDAAKASMASRLAASKKNKRKNRKPTGKTTALTSRGGGDGVALHPAGDDKCDVNDTGAASDHQNNHADAKIELNEYVNLAVQSAEAAGVHSMPVTDAALGDSMEMSETEARQLEQAHLIEAIMRSNTEARNADGVNIVRLTSHSPQIKSQILESAALQACFDRVRSAGCEVNPSWANGAILLVPMSAEQLVESQIELKAHNIVLLSDDIAVVQEVLAGLPKRKRPAVRPECHADRMYDNARSFATDGHGANQADEFTTSHHSDAHEFLNKCPPIDLVVEHTFLHFPLRRLELSESSEVANSAPAFGVMPTHPNPRRWSKKKW